MTSTKDILDAGSFHPLLTEREIKVIRDGFGQVSDEDLAAVNEALKSGVAGEQVKRLQEEAEFRQRLKVKMVERYPDAPESQKVKLARIQKELKQRELEEGGMCHCGEFMLNHPSAFDCGHSPVRMNEPDDSNDPFRFAAD